MNKKIYFLLCVLMIFIVSCGDNSQEVETDEKQNTATSENQVWSKEEIDQFEKERELDEENAKARALNDKGVRLLQMSQPYPKGSPIKDSLLNEALNNLNKAIGEQRNYHHAYYNKANVLIAMKKYDAALKAIEELLQVKKNDPGTFLLMGMIYEKSGNMGKAQQQYERTPKAYEEKLKTPMATLQDSLEKDQVLLFLEGKEKALKRINERLKKDPQNVDLLIAKQSIEQFDREEYFKNF